jgi:hypothetical protein
MMAPRLYTGHAERDIWLLSMSFWNMERTLKRQAATRSVPTPLHCACYSGHLAVVKALLSSGVDILAANNYGELPIHIFSCVRCYLAPPPEGVRNNWKKREQKWILVSLGYESLKLEFYPVTLGIYGESSSSSWLSWASFLDSIPEHDSSVIQFLGLMLNSTIA